METEGEIKGLIIPIITFTIIIIIFIVSIDGLFQYISVWNIEGFKLAVVFFVISTISLVVMMHITIKNRKELFYP